jgi:hypothetical protein
VRLWHTRRSIHHVGATKKIPAQTSRVATFKSRSRHLVDPREKEIFGIQGPDWQQFFVTIRSDQDARNFASAMRIKTPLR